MGEPWSGETLEGLPVAFDSAEKIVQIGGDTIRAANVVAGPFTTCRGVVYVVDTLFSGGYEEAGTIEEDEIAETDGGEVAEADGDEIMEIDDGETAVEDGDESAETDGNETAETDDYETAVTDGDESAETKGEVSDGNDNKEIDDPGEFGPGAVNGTEVLLEEILPED